MVECEEFLPSRSSSSTCTLPAEIHKLQTVNLQIMLPLVETFALKVRNTDLIYLSRQNDSHDIVYEPAFDKVNGTNMTKNMMNNEKQNFLVSDVCSCFHFYPNQLLSRSRPS